VILWCCATILLYYCATVLLSYYTSVRLSVYSWLVQVQPWLLSNIKKNQQYYFVCNNFIYSDHSIFSTGTVSLTMLTFYCDTVMLCYRDTGLPFYNSTVLLCYCTSVRLSVYSWLVQVQPWLLSEMHKIKQYYFVCNNIIYLQTFQFFLLALCHWLYYSSFVILWYCATNLL
jgi:hypothetical protein